MNNVDINSIYANTDLFFDSKEVPLVLLESSEKDAGLIPSGLTLLQFFCHCCTTKEFPNYSFCVYFGQKGACDQQFMRYTKQKSLEAEIYSINTSVFSFENNKPNEYCKLLIAPYNTQYHFFEEDENSPSLLRADQEPNPELTWDNVEQYKDDRYKDEDGKKYIMGLFKYQARTLIRYKIYKREIE